MGVCKVKSLSIVGAAFLFLSMVSMIITVALYTENAENKSERGRCYVLAWSSIILSLGTTLGALIMPACRRDIPNKEV